MFIKIKHIISILVLVLVNWHVSANAPQQTSEKNDTIIQWVGEFPAKDGNKKKSNFSKKVVELVVGKNEQIDLKRPVSVLAFNPDSFIVFDQETGIPFFIIDKQPKLIKCFKKKNLFFPSLVGSCFFKNNEILFTDSKLNKIFYFSENKKGVKVLNNSLKLEQPTGIAYLPSKDEIWVVETAAHRISILNSHGELIKHIGHRGTGNGEFNYPTSIWIDDEGTCYIVDAMNFRVQIFDKEGQFLSSFGKQGNASGYFARPKGIATDKHHNIYVTDALFHTVQIFDKKGKFLYNFGEQGRQRGQFWMPSGIYIDKNDYIYIADTYNYRVQMFKINTHNIK